MEIRARYVLIGLFVLVVIVGGFGFIYRLSNGGGTGNRTTYRVEFDAPISGLSAGSPVLFNGLTVGEVTGLGLDAAKPGEVLATIAVDARTPVRTDTHIGLVFSGLTGSAAVALVGGSATAAPVAAGPDGVPLLVADPAAMKDLTAAARDALNHLDQVVTDNSSNIKDAIANIDSFAAALGKNSDKVDGIMAGLSKLAGGGKPDIRITYDLAPPTPATPISPVPDAQIVVPTPTSAINMSTQSFLAQSEGGDAVVFPDVRWADNLPDLIGARVVDAFDKAGDSKVGGPNSDIQADYKLAIDLRAFHLTGNPSSAAEVDFSAKLLDANNAIVGSQAFSGTAPIATPNQAAAAAAAFNQAFQKATTDLVAWTVKTLAAAPPEAKKSSDDNSGASDQSGASDNSGASDSGAAKTDTAAPGTAPAAAGSDTSASPDTTAPAAAATTTSQ